MREGKGYRLLIKLGVEKVSPKEAEEKLKDYLTGKLEVRKKRRKNEVLYPETPVREDLGVKVQTSKRTDQLEQEVLSYLEDSIYNQIEMDIQTLDRFIAYLKRADHYTYQILTLFYAEGETWVGVADKLPFSESTCRNRRDRVLEELVEWFN